MKKLTLFMAGDEGLRHCSYYQQRGLPRTVLVEHVTLSATLPFHCWGFGDLVYLETSKSNELGEAKRCHSLEILWKLMSHSQEVHSGFPWSGSCDSSPPQHPLPSAQRQGKSKQTISGGFTKYYKCNTFLNCPVLKTLTLDEGSGAPCTF